MTQTLQKNEGIISQIIGPVLDVEFTPGHLPDIYTALEIKDKNSVGETVSLVAEVLRGLLDGASLDWARQGNLKEGTKFQIQEEDEED